MNVTNASSPPTFPSAGIESTRVINRSLSSLKPDEGRHQRVSSAKQSAKAVRRNQRARPSESIKGHQWQSMAISGHQCTLEQAHDAQDASDANDPQHHGREGQHDVRCELVEQRVEGAVVSACMQGRPSVAISVPGRAARWPRGRSRTGSNCPDAIRGDRKRSEAIRKQSECDWVLSGRGCRAAK